MMTVTAYRAVPRFADPDLQNGKSPGREASIKQVGGVHGLP
jgi:hypothetical protein